MRRNVASPTATFGILVWGVSFLSAQSLTDSELKRLRLDFVKAEDSSQAGPAAHELFERASFEQCKTLMFDDNVSIALLAAWKAMHHKEYSTVVPLAASQRFNAFVEAKTGSPIPPHWDMQFALEFVRHEDVKNSEVRQLYHSDVASYWENWSLVRRRIAGGLLFHASTTKVNEVDNTILFELRGHKLKVHKNVLNWTRKYDCYVCEVAIGPKKSFIAFYSYPANPYPLLCIDTKTGTVKWVTEIWGAGHLVRGEHLVGISALDETVAVFGKTSCSIYTEGFDIETGAQQYRFAENYWSFRPAFP